VAQVEEFGNQRKQVVDLNLVPFIDLMSVCIIFLLITAVWTQVSMIQLGSSIYSNKTEERPTPLTPFTEVVLRVDVLPEGFRLVADQNQSLIPHLGENLYNQESLITKLKEVKLKYPNKVDGIVSIRDQIRYKYLISAMDAFLQAGFERISIATMGVQ